MSYSNDVSMAFFKEDYENIILPAVQKTDYAKEKLATAEFCTYSADRYNYGKEIVGIRFRAYNNWGYDDFSNAFESARTEVEHDFIRFGEDVTDAEIQNSLYVLDLHAGYGGLLQDTYQDNYEEIIVNLAMYMANHLGMDKESIAKVAIDTEEAYKKVYCRKEVIENLLSQIFPK